MGDPIALRQRVNPVLGAGVEVHPLLDRAQRGKLAGGRVAADAEVRASFGERLGASLPRRLVSDDHADGRCQLLHGHDGLDEQMPDVVGVADDRERRVLREVLHLFQPVVEPVGVRQHLLGEGQQLPADSRQFGPRSLAALEQRAAQQSFQIADPLGHGGLGERQLGRRGSEGPGAGQGLEGVHLLERQARYEPLTAGVTPAVAVGERHVLSCRRERLRTAVNPGRAVSRTALPGVSSPRR